MDVYYEGNGGLRCFLFQILLWGLAGICVLPASSLSEELFGNAVSGMLFGLLVYLASDWFLALGQRGQIGITLVGMVVILAQELRVVGQVLSWVPLLFHPSLILVISFVLAVVALRFLDIFLWRYFTDHGEYRWNEVEESLGEDPAQAQPGSV